jgi:hypothetical protein
LDGAIDDVLLPHDDVLLRYVSQLPGKGLLYMN